jgi:hypothetical protein
MSVEIKLLDRGIGIFIKWKGLLTGQELINTLTEIYRSEENAKKLKYSIADFTHVESVDMSNSEIQVIAEIHKNAAKMSPDRVLALAASKDLAFGLSRVWEANIYETQWETIIVRSMDEAESWVKEKVKNKFSIDITMA